MKRSTALYLLIFLTGGLFGSALVCTYDSLSKPPESPLYKVGECFLIKGVNGNSAAIGVVTKVLKYGYEMKQIDGDGNKRTGVAPFDALDVKSSSYRLDCELTPFSGGDK